MRSRVRTISGIVAGAVLAGALGSRGASAQLDHRVNLQVDQAQGQLLDSNFQVGGSRFNPSQPWAFDGGFRSNAIVSGNVTGLSYFHGSSVPNSNQFRDFMPSSALSGFNARSVGISDIQAYQTPSPSFFFDPRTTVADAGMIQQGLNMPGSSTIISPNIPPQTLGVDRAEIDRLLKIEVPELAEGRQTGPFIPDMGLRQKEIPSGRAIEIPNLSSGLFPSAYQSAATSSIFGAPELAEMTASPGNRTLGEALDPGRTTDRFAPNPNADSTLGQRTPWEPGPAISPQVDPLLAAKESLESVKAANDPLAAQQPFGVRYVVPREQAAGAVTAGQFGSQATTTEADVFSGLLEAFLVRQDAGKRPAGFAAMDETGVRDNANQRTAAMPDGPPAAAPADGDAPESPPSSDQTAIAAKWAEDRLATPIDTFVGRHENQFNRYMSRAEMALREGKYYVAAQLYGLASGIDPRNPLPLLGRGHAYIATGDYMSAFETIRQGLERFPQIAAFRLDLPAMAGQADIFDLRRSDLEKRLQDGEFYKLRFLLGYLEVYSGQVDDGIANLQKAAKGAPAGDIIGMFPDLLLGKRELPDVAGKSRAPKP